MLKNILKKGGEASVISIVLLSMMLLKIEMWRVNMALTARNHFM
jgi:hypothetical protein